MASVKRTEAKGIVWEATSPTHDCVSCICRSSGSVLVCSFSPGGLREEGLSVPTFRKLDCSVWLAIDCLGGGGEPELSGLLLANLGVGLGR